ncbi:MAG: hypothetical protein HC906_10740 [Bacteroidales bacterium]|nr:hypothetical protein [Bacteroidales bacterium]
MRRNLLLTMIAIAAFTTMFAQNDTTDTEKKLKPGGPGAVYLPLLSIRTLDLNMVPF